MAKNLGIPYTDEKPFYFISYNSEDESRVAEYAKWLVEYNLPVWYDNGLKIGEVWEKEIAEKIDECQAVIMFLSKKIFLKDDSYVHKEFELATEYSMKPVYVMMLDKIDKPDVPVRFRSWWISVSRLHCINVYEYSSPEECVKKLAESLGLFKGEESHTDDTYADNGYADNSCTDDGITNEMPRYSDTVSESQEVEERAGLCCPKCGSNIINKKSNKASMAAEVGALAALTALNPLIGIGAATGRYVLKKAKKSNYVKVICQNCGHEFEVDEKFVK